jgi:hypothetical protein
MDDVIESGHCVAYFEAQNGAFGEIANDLSVDHRDVGSDAVFESVADEVFGVVPVVFRFLPAGVKDLSVI